MIIGKFQQEEGVFTGTIVAFGGTTLVRIAKTDLKGIDYTVTVASVGLDLGIAWQKKSAKGTTICRSSSITRSFQRPSTAPW